MKTHTTVIEKIRSNYVQKETTDFDRLKSLDKKVKSPAKTFAFVHGSVSSLILGTGMCMAMKVIGGGMILGIGVGLVGIALTSTTYLMYKAILKKRKAKYSQEVIDLSNKLTNN